MKFFRNVKENFKGYSISMAILLFSVVIIHKIRFNSPPLYLDMLVTKIVIAPFLLFGFMCLTLLFIGGKE